MTAQQWLQLASTLVTLIGTLIWPAALLVCIVIFRRQIAAFLENLAEVNVKTPIGEASAKRGNAAAAAAVGAAEAKREHVTDGQEAPADARDIAEVLPDRRAQRRIAGSRVLWVDDHPRNNRYERQALEALGVLIDLSTSTDAALEMAAETPYALIISDMSRPPDSRAGYTLLDSLSFKRLRTPVVFYTGSQTKIQAAEALAHGAAGSTSSPRELISIVTRILDGA
jgi:CheY-like chemotaxis protein